MNQVATRRSPDRRRTEQALLDAFETVLVRDGIRRLSVNALVDEARVGKPLLYRYFGDLPGLVRAWGARRGFWPSSTDPRHLQSRNTRDDAAFRREMADELVATGEYLRSNPVSLELLAEELTAESELSDAFAQARNEHGRPFLAAMFTDRRYTRRDNRRLIIVLTAAVTYLAMRARRSPNFMGLRLDSEAGWEDAMAMIREIARLQS